MSIAWCDTCRTINEEEALDRVMHGWVVVDERWRCKPCRRPQALPNHTAEWGARNGV